MNFDNLKSRFTVEQHLILEFFLCLLIAFLFFKPTPSNKINTDGFSKDTALMFALEVDGKVKVTPNGGETSTITPEKNLFNQNLILSSIGIAIVRATDIKSHAIKQVGIFDRIISPAMATAHNLPDHVYYNYNWSIGNVTGCYRYDITGYPGVPPKYVGACI